MALNRRPYSTKEATKNHTPSHRLQVEHKQKYSKINIPFPAKVLSEIGNRPGSPFEFFYWFYRCEGSILNHTGISFAYPLLTSISYNYLTKFENKVYSFFPYLSTTNLFAAVAVFWFLPQIARTSSTD